MWFIFLVSCIVVALAALFVIWVGSKIFRSIERKNRLFDIETETYEEVKKRLKREINSDKENKE